MNKIKNVRTCYGCPKFYQDHPNLYATKHCGIVDHYNECEGWKDIREEDSRHLNNDK